MAVKLSYYDIAGRAEPLRWILLYGGIDFEDIRAPYQFPTPSLPPDMKAKCRWGQVPLVEFEGKSLVQSLAIGRFYARKANLVPEDDYQAALCDEYIDAIGDLGGLIWPAVMMPDSKEKEVKMKEAIAKIKTRFLDVFESIIKANGGKHVVGDKLTWADIFLAVTIDGFQNMLQMNLAEGHENVNKLTEMVKNTPKIKAWLEKRPKSMF